MKTNRRFFLKSASYCSAGLLAVGLAGRRKSHASTSLAIQEPLRDNRSSHVRLGIAAYSFRKHFAYMKGKPQQPAGGQSMDMKRFIDFCGEQRCGAELTSYFFQPDPDDQYFLDLKRHAFVGGVPIVGTAIGNNFTIGRGEQLENQIKQAKQWIDRAALLGAPHIRFFAGTRQQLESSPERMKIAIESLQECVDYAAARGIFVGVENHGQLTSAQVLEIVNGIDSDWFGVNLDTGNFISDDPYRDLETCAPFAVNVQLKVKMKNPAGEISDADFEKIAVILKEAGYRGYVVLEFEEADPFKHVPEVMKQLRSLFAA